MSGPVAEGPARRAAAAPTAMTLDVDALDRLRELDPAGKGRLLERVLRAFETSAARLSLQFREARRKDDVAGIRHVAHTLKSSSASIGAIALSQLCGELEVKIRNDAAADVEPGIAAMTAALDLALQAIERQLAQT